VTLDLSIFEGRRILITGHTGFKGSWLYKVLDLSGAKLDGYSLPPLENSHISQLNLINKVNDSQFADIRNYEQLERKIQTFSPEVIFHLAAQPLVRRSYNQTRYTFETNFMGGVNLLESLRKANNLEALVFITSDKAYENKEWDWGYRESDQLGGKDPYSASKGAMEIAFSSYARTILSNAFPLVTARAGNVIGGGDWSEDRIVPDLVRAHIHGKPIRLRNPHSTRPWQHVLEPISGYLHLASAMLGRRNLKSSYNFGPDFEKSHTVLDVANGIISTLGHVQIETAKESDDVPEAHLLQLNCDLAKQDLAWRPKWEFQDTVEKTGLWYKSFLSQQDMNEVTENQIASYFWSKDD
jgi:CDP-glucose 4,6-dehydratase